MDELELLDELELPPPPPPLDELELLDFELELEGPDELEEEELPDEEDDVELDELLLEEESGVVELEELALPVEDELAAGPAGFSTESQAMLERPTAMVPPDNSFRNWRRRSRRSSSPSCLDIPTPSVRFLSAAALPARRPDRYIVGNRRSMINEPFASCA